MPADVTLAPLDDRLLIWLLVMLWVVTDDEPPVMPTTAPPVPDDVNAEIVLVDTVCAAPPLLDPIAMPVIAFVPLMPLMVLLEIVVPLLPKLLEMMVMALEPPAMLLNVFPVIVLAGPLALDAPSVLLHPATVVAPATVMFEKLFPVLNICEPSTEDALEEKNVIVPPLGPLLNVPAIRLLLQFSMPVAVMFPACCMKAIPPALLRLRLVNVLLFTLAVAEPAYVLLINRGEPVLVFTP